MEVGKLHKKHRNIYIGCHYVSQTFGVVLLNARRIINKTCLYHKHNIQPKI